MVAPRTLAYPLFDRFPLLTVQVGRQVHVAVNESNVIMCLKHSFRNVVVRLLLNLVMGTLRLFVSG